MSAYICLHKIRCRPQNPECCNWVSGAFSPWDINCSALCVLDVSILGNQSAEFHVTPVFCSVAASCSHYVPYRRRKLVLVNGDFTVRFCGYFCVCQTNGTLALSGGKAFLDIVRRPRKWFLCKSGFKRTPEPTVLSGCCSKNATKSRHLQHPPDRTLCCSHSQLPSSDIGWQHLLCARY